MCVVEGVYVAIVLLCRAIARIGEVPQAEGFENCLAFLQKIILADYVGTPTRAWKRGLPLFASQTEGDIAVFPAFNYDAQLHCIGQ